MPACLSVKLQKQAGYVGIAQGGGFAQYSMARYEVLFDGPGARRSDVCSAAAGGVQIPLYGDRREDAYLIEKKVSPEPEVVGPTAFTVACLWRVPQGPPLERAFRRAAHLPVKGE